MKVELNLNIPELDRPYEGDYQLNQEILTYLFETANIDRKLNRYLSGKSVVVVGPASYMDGSNQGSFIDSFDVVVRLNGFWKPDESLHPHVGKRTNIRYHSGAEFPNTGGIWNIPDMLSYGVEYACIQYPRYLDYFHSDIKKFEQHNSEYNMPFHCWADLELYLSFHHYLGTRMNVGIACVADLMFYDLAKLHVTGFSFYAHKGGHDWIKGAKPDGYFLDDYDQEKHTFINHAQLPQMRLIRELQTFDNRLTIDSEMETILRSYGV
jgi:hypothetical protein